MPRDRDAKMTEAEMQHPVDADLRTNEVERWVLQSVLSVNPSRPEWTGLIMTCYAGWKDWNDKRVRGGLCSAHSYSDSFAFDDEQTAIACMTDLAARNPQYRFRVIRRHKTIEEEFVASDEPIRRANDEEVERMLDRLSALALSEEQRDKLIGLLEAKP